MTQFRSRDEFSRQVEDLAEDIASGSSVTLFMRKDLASRHIEKAEARGAEEERGKVEESERPAAYRWTYGIGGKWRFSEKFPTATSPARKPKFISPLYTRPANVAALEARVRELEGALHKLLDAISCTGSTEEPDVLIAEGEARAALKREGGV